MRVNLNSVRVFCAAAKHLNFRLAAQQLHRTHGAVAQQVRQLEQQMGVTLFERLPRGLALTPQGDMYYQECRKSIARIDKATAELMAPQGQLRLSVPPSLASRWLVRRLSDFSAQHPDIEIQLSASDKLVQLDQGEADLAIRIAANSSDPELIYEFLAPADLCMVASPNFEVQGDLNDPNVLARQRLIEDSHPSWQGVFDQYDMQAPKASMSFNQTTLALDSAIDGMGIALSPRLYIEREIADKRLKVLAEYRNQQHYSFYLVYPKQDKQGSPARQAFVAWLREQLSGVRPQVPKALAPLMGQAL